MNRRLEWQQQPDLKDYDAPGRHSLVAACLRTPPDTTPLPTIVPAALPPGDIGPFPR